MSFLNGLSKEDELTKLKSIAKIILVRDVVNHGLSTDSLEGLTAGQVINYLFADGIYFESEGISEYDKKIFAETIVPCLPRIANEIIYRCSDLGLYHSITLL